MIPPAGTVEDVVNGKTDDTINAWRGKNVIGGIGMQEMRHGAAGITANRNMAVGEVVDNHAISRIVVLPENSKIATQYIVNNALRLCRTVMCRWRLRAPHKNAGENMHLRTVENEAVVIIAGSMVMISMRRHQWLSGLSSSVSAVAANQGCQGHAVSAANRGGSSRTPKLRILVATGNIELQNGDNEKYVEEHDYKHGLFNHPQFKSISANGLLVAISATRHAVIIRRKPVAVIAEDVLTLTGGMGASSITVLPDAVKDFKAAEVQVSRQSLLAAGIGCRIVWHQPLEQVDPCEAKCLFEKSSSLEFFNFDTTLQSHGSDGLVQHALLETVKRATHNTIYVER
ncbi:hypothetical protein, conserved [Babesia bigemina]|uniref:Uncharacterized protein n=1 Tax=Babesia bigemina TaxID=5866 RepID=A0A061D8L4_BABBI|nr:hypothetical protein, conserved [Babesia bigemina]CDR94090.1 hypothetical protein, conserved [Babesia bigemina]|eukprot:XP_012766276.1 hypothetical protein, conserved [Babesia bigemina]